MNQPEERRSRLARALDVLAAAGPMAALCCSVSIVFASHRWFSFGFWANAEPLIVAFHATAGLGTAALLLVWWRHPDRFWSAVRHPFVLIPAALSLWSLSMAPFARFPLLSVLGTPQTGEGALWYANLAVLVACALYVRERAGQWRALVAVAVAVVFAVAAIKSAAVSRGTYAFFWVRDFVAYPAMALPYLALAHADGRWKWLPVVALAAGFAVLAESNNNTATVLYLLAIAMVGVGSLAALHRRLEPIVHGRVAGATVVGLFALVPVYFIATGIGVEAIVSLKSRHLVAVVMGEAMTGDYLALLTGNGWGHTRGAMLAHLNAAGENMWQMRWDFLGSSYPSTHDWAIEALYSAGIPGLSMALAMYVAVPVFAERRRRVFATAFAACLAALNTVWYTFTLFVPFQALALASLAGVAAPGDRRPRAPVRILVPAALAALLGAQAAAAAVLLVFGLKVSGALAVYADPPAGLVEYRFPADINRTNSIFAETVRNRLRRVGERSWAADDPARPDQRRVIGWMFEDLERRIEKRSSPYLLVAGIAAFTEITYLANLAWLRPDYESRTALWGRWVERLLDEVPGRTDVALGYFSLLLSKRRAAELDRLTSRILARRPDDAIALYFKGAALLVDGRPQVRALAMEFLRRGFKGGIERYMPIDAALKEKILKSR